MAEQDVNSTNEPLNRGLTVLPLTLRWTQIWTVITLVVVLVYALYKGFSIGARDLGAHDLVAYWSLPRSLLLGFGLYEFEWLEHVQRSVGFVGWFVGGEYQLVMTLWNPPPILPLLLPLSAVGFTPAVLLWMSLNVGLFGYAALHFNRVQSRPMPPILALLCSVAVAPFAYAVYHGQPTPMLAGIGVLAWLALHRKRETAGGILLVPLMLKPHIFSSLLVILLIAAIRGRQWKAPAVTAIFILFLTASLSLLDTEWFTGWQTQGISTAVSMSVWDFGSSALNLPDAIPMLVFGFGIVYSIWRYRNIQVVTPALLGEAALLSLVFSPYLGQTDLTVALPAVLIFSSALWRPWWRLALFIPPLLINNNVLITVATWRRSIEPSAQALHWFTTSPTIFETEMFIRVLLTLLLFILFWRKASRDYTHFVDAEAKPS